MKAAGNGNGVSFVGLYSIFCDIFIIINITCTTFNIVNYSQSHSTHIFND